MSPTGDHDVRALLDDAVADVEPRRGLHEITARTARPRRSRTWGAAGAVVATAAVIAAVSLVGGLPGTSGTDQGSDRGSGTVAARDGGDDQTKTNPNVDAPLFIGSPADGEDVSSPFTVTGKATAFEGNVQWELEQGSKVVRRGFTTAEECCTLSPYSFEVTAPPGTYTLVVHDEDVGEGPPPARDTVQVTVH